MNCGIAMFKPTIVQKKSWWVPSEHPVALAVPLEDPAQYRERVEEKLADLVMQTPLKVAQSAVRAALGDFADLTNLETLEEIAIEGKRTFVEAGGGEFRALPCLNESPRWIEALAEIARGR